MNSFALPRCMIAGQIRRSYHRPPFSLDPSTREWWEGIRFDLSDHARALESVARSLPLDEQIVGLSADDGRVRRVLRVPDAPIHAHALGFSRAAHHLRSHPDLPYVAGISAEEARARRGHQNRQRSAKAAGVKRITGEAWIQLANYLLLILVSLKLRKPLNLHPATPSPRGAV